MKYNCIIILGATASGKTKYSIELAKRLNGEIINADSQQLIKGLDIGTAKITEKEKEGIAHHLFDIIEIGEDFSASEYREKAMDKIREVWKHGNLPIIVGGTGFYINSLIYNYSFGDSDKNDDLRNHYIELAKAHGNEYVYNQLKKIDPTSAEALHPNDLKRVIRAIEIFESSGQKKSDQFLEKNQELNPFIVGINMDRSNLYKNINLRVDKMITDGLEKEVLFLKEKGYYNTEAFQLPIGYSEWYGFFNGTQSREETIEKIKQNSRHYAKRQITWFRRMENINWYNIEEKSFNDVICNIIKNFE